MKCLLLFNLHALFHRFLQLQLFSSDREIPVLPVLELLSKFCSLGCFSKCKFLLQLIELYSQLLFKVLHLLFVVLISLLILLDFLALNRDNLIVLIIFSPTLNAQYISLFAEAEDGAILERVEAGLRESREALPQKIIIDLGYSFASIELSSWSRYYYILLLDDEVINLLGELSVLGGAYCGNRENILLSPKH